MPGEGAANRRTAPLTRAFNTTGNAHFNSEPSVADLEVKHELKGKEPDLYVALRPGCIASDEIVKKVENAVVKDIRSIARPRKVWIISGMPKTRSGKIMHRILTTISKGTDVGDVMSLANPEIVVEITEMA